MPLRVVDVSMFLRGPNQDLVLLATLEGHPHLVNEIPEGHPDGREALSRVKLSLHGRRHNLDNPDGVPAGLPLLAPELRPHLPGEGAQGGLAGAVVCAARQRHEGPGPT